MLRSLYSGVSGAKAHQARMDVIGNNIANINTTAFKTGRATFQEVLAQTLKGAGSVSVGRGSINPMQVGLGTSLSTIQNVFNQGNLNNTGADTDLAIQGTGFFILKDLDTTRYTRDGHFQVGTGGYLSAPSGQRLQGYARDEATGAIDYTKLQDLKLDFGGKPIAQQTTNVTFGGNLDAGTPSWTTTMAVYAPSGEAHNFDVAFTNTGTDTWTYALTSTNVPPDTVTVGTGTVTFANGQWASSVGPNPGDPARLVFTLGAGTQTIDMNFQGMTQMAFTASGKMVNQDGFPAGTLERVSVDSFGRLVGNYSNQRSVELGQVALADFDNPAGLYKSGDSCYESTGAAGLRGYGTPGSEGRGDIAAMYLEMSNVDLSEEFTDMIVTQRGLQANTKVITTSDEILQELLAMKR